MAITGCATTVEENAQKNSENVPDSNMIMQKNALLSIDLQKCIGCGKCARIASAHFAMDEQTKKAMVIKQESHINDSVEKAIRTCPTRAISG